MNLDSDNYLESYHSDYVDGIEYLYEFTENIAISMGFTYAKFKFLFSFLGLLLMRIVVKQYLDKTGAFYLLYMLYPFLLDIIQNKNFLGMIFLTLALCVFEKKGKAHKILYVFLVIVASGFHNVFLLFIPFVFLDKVENTYIRKKIFGIIAICSIVLMFLPDVTINLINKFLNSFSSTRSEYYQQVSTRLGYFVMLTQQIVAFSISFYELKLAKMNKSYKVMDCRRRSLVQMVYNLNLYAFVFCPLYRLNGQFTRLIQNMFPIMHVAFLSTLSLSKGVNRTWKIYIKFMYILYVFILFFRIFIMQHYDDIIVPTFVNNYLWA